MGEKKKFENTRRLRSKDGTITYIWGNHLHNWEGPAYIPQGNPKLAEYHIHGFQYSLDEWKEMKRDRYGLPWYKDPRFNSRH